MTAGPAPIDRPRGAPRRTVNLDVVCWCEVGAVAKMTPEQVKAGQGWSCGLPGCEAAA